ncbi:3',5'-cyclic-AMP phosphodiesterase [Pseudomonas sp. KSR10]|uniref:Serine/threonine protein phosphatase n=1 Tax=Stutzerimonas stutzeri TaxID=316 RepID=A0A0D9AE88_STUST|nr:MULTISPECIES: 3',5'-cyclic-AMP phosphodiesterase [Pseudomonadaceae]KJH79343.1 serine/threonine protein phosphatase [Stutzerimonas stutzeri]MCG6540937.1 3',5'-cyclic-AMP phosphodiesterase [Pseudomonas sp. KSR10]
MAASTLTAEKDSVLLVQLTDSHLFAEAGGKLLGLDTGESLQRVVDLVLDEQPRIDLMLATGDLSQDGSLASYQRFRQLSERIDAPVRWCPGNHDELAAMQEATRGSEIMLPVLDIGAWRVILLDTLVPGSVFGMLRDDQLALLERTLRDAPERHHLICLHHHPVTIGSRWMDSIGLHNRDALFAVLDRFPCVQAVLWGHIHQEFDALRGDVRLLATPSTGVQFAPGSEDFQVDTCAPGYRWLRLYADGRLETGVSRVVGTTFEVDYSVKGY